MDMTTKHLPIAFVRDDPVGRVTENYIEQYTYHQASAALHDEVADELLSWHFEMTVRPLSAVPWLAYDEICGNTRLLLATRRRTRRDNS